MKSQVKEISLTSRRVTKVWGEFTDLYRESNYLVKHLLVKPGERLSLQSHNHRSEVWIVVKGFAVVQRGEDQYVLRSGQNIYISSGEKHRIENKTTDDLVIIEVQLGDKIDETDIVRYEDDYGRQGNVEM